MGGNVIADVYRTARGKFRKVSDYFTRKRGKRTAFRSDISKMRGKVYRTLGFRPALKPDLELQTGLKLASRKSESSKQSSSSPTYDYGLNPIGAFKNFKEKKRLPDPIEEFEARERSMKSKTPKEIVSRKESRSSFSRKILNGRQEIHVFLNRL